MILPICIYGHSALRKKTKEISLNNENWNILLNNLFDTMYNYNGLGLSAPQIGSEFSVFVIDIPFHKNNGIDFCRLKKVFINPYIIKKSKKKIRIEEGCLSIPNIYEKIERSDNIQIQYTDKNQRTVNEHYEGFAAYVIQHEYDHLEGILFTDYVKGIRKQMIRSKLNKLINRKTKNIT